MENYKHMYAILCGAIDDVIDGLREIPLAVPYANRLEKALLDAEDAYLSVGDNEVELPFNENKQ